MTGTVDGAGAVSFTLVTQYYPPEVGAAQVRLGSIVAELLRRGHPVEVVTALPNYPLGRIFPGWSRRAFRRITEDGAGVRRVWVWASMGSGAGRMANYLSFGLMSVLGIIATPWTEWTLVEYPTLPGALPAVVLGRLRRQSVAVIVADLWVDSIVEVGALPEGRLVAALRRVERWMLRRAHVVTAVTEGVREALVDKGVDPGRLAWLPNGADTELFRPGDEDPEMRRTIGAAADEHLFLYAGTHGYVHGLEVVLDAAELLEGHPVRFVLVGDGSEKPQLVRAAQRRGLTNVTFLDPVPPVEVSRLLRSATAGLATVRSGELYRTIRSAKAVPTMAAGRPVIYSGDDEGARLVGAIGAGLVTAPGDAGRLAAAVLELAGDAATAERLGAAGRAWVEKNASWHHLVGRWLGELGEPDARVGAGARDLIDR